MRADFLEGFVKKYKFFFFLFVFLGCGILYALPRVAGLKSLPPFIDEFIYIHWAQQGFYNADLRLSSLADGKQPLFIWLITYVLQFVSNPLIAGKLVSLTVGFGTLIGLGYVAYLLFKRFDIAVLSMVLYALFPFAIVHDRLAIYDSFVTFWFVWSMVGTILFVRKPNLGYAFLLANIMGAALLTKSSVIIFFFLIPLFYFLQPIKQWKKMFWKTFLFGLLVLAFSYLYQSVMYLSSSAAFINTRNSEFVRPFADIINIKGLLLSFSNVITVFGWIITYVTLPTLIVSIIPLLRKKLLNREVVFLYASFLYAFVIFCFVGRNIFPRHIFFMTVPLLILASYASIWVFSVLKTRAINVLFAIFLVIGMVVVDFTILHNFPTSFIPSLDRYQFANGWPAGYGVREITKYLQAASQGQQIVIAVEGSYGSYPKTVAQVYFSQSPNVEIVDFDTALSKTIPSQIVEAGKTKPVYLFFNINQTYPLWPMEKVIEVRKGVGTDYMRLFKYIPPAQK